MTETLRRGRPGLKVIGPSLALRYAGHRWCLVPVRPLAMQAAFPLTQCSMRWADCSVQMLKRWRSSQTAPAVAATLRHTCCTMQCFCLPVYTAWHRRGQLDTWVVCALQTSAAYDAAEGSLTLGPCVHCRQALHVRLCSCVSLPVHHCSWHQDVPLPGCTPVLPCPAVIEAIGLT